VTIREQKNKAQQPPFQVAARQRQSGGNTFGWELRQTMAWTWILPLFVIVGSLVFSWFSYTAEIHRQSDLLHNAAQKVASVLDYTATLRDTLELVFPLLGVLMATDVIVKEWRRGTLPLLATRKPILWFLVIRFGYLLSYLLLTTMGAILLSWWLTPHPQTNLSIGVWLWQTLLTILAPTLLLIAIGLLVAHLSVNTIAGYVLPACCWLANWSFAQQVEQAHTTNALLSYLLFGWSEKDLTPQPDAWFTGKVLLCVLAVLLLAIQPLIVLRVALQHKPAE